jgi:hypothetical protein
MAQHPIRLAHTRNEGHVPASVIDDAVKNEVHQHSTWYVSSSVINDAKLEG